MTTREEYFPVLVWFLDIVDKKLNLPKNVKKSTWHDIELWELADNLRQELDELEEVIDRTENRGKRKSIISECADIAAFAMMIADNARREIK